MIPEKYKNTCPLDHSTYEKYIECNCNFGSANEVWYFKEQEIVRLKQQLKEAVEVIKLSKQTLHLSKSSIGYEQYCDRLNKFLAKYQGGGK